MKRKLLIHDSIIFGIFAILALLLVFILLVSSCDVSVSGSVFWLVLSYVAAVALFGVALYIAYLNSIIYQKMQRKLEPIRCLDAELRNISHVRSE